VIVHPAVIGGASVPFFAPCAQEGQLDVVEVDPFGEERSRFAIAPS